ncbi:MAG: hypothetical protein K8H75_08560 [Sulfuricella sp.]|nr:hypothetical protein [Sulfuricella sp.]
MTLPTEPKSGVGVDIGLDRKAVVRRYIDLPKYIQLLRSCELYFPRVDQFPDKFEGVLPPVIRKAIDDAHSKGEVDRSSQTRYEQLRTGAYVSCWSSGAMDNMALWQLYGTASSGVAVDTTIGELIDACLKWDEKVWIHKVQYLDHFANPDMGTGSSLDPLQFKHVGYRFEEEIRLVIGRMHPQHGETQRPIGLGFPVDLSRLIRSVVVSPEAKPWFFDLVSDVTSRYNVSAPVIPSPLTTLPT